MPGWPRAMSAFRRASNIEPAGLDLGAASEASALLQRFNQNCSRCRGAGLLRPHGLSSTRPGAASLRPYRKAFRRIGFAGYTFFETARAHGIVYRFSVAPRRLAARARRRFFD